MEQEETLKLMIPADELTPAKLFDQHGLYLRHAVDDDAEAIFDLVVTVMAEFQLVGKKQQEGMPAKTIKSADRKRVRSGLKDVLTPCQYYADERHVLEALTDKDGTIVGCVAFGCNKRDEHLFELKRLYLHRSLRGKGLGKWLFERRLRMVLELGATRITSTVATPLKANLHLHSSHGFAVTLGATSGRHYGDYRCLWPPPTNSVYDPQSQTLDSS